MRPPAPAEAAARPRRAVSPAARQLAAQRGLDPETLAGHGADGAVIRADVAAAAAGISPLAALTAPAAPAASRAARGGFDPARMREAIGAAMARSKREIPHYYLSSTIDFTAAQQALDAYNAPRAASERLLPAVLLLEATARALVEVPQLNGFWTPQGFQPGAGVHIGWAIGLRGGGLVAPAIHHADRLDRPGLMAALRDLVQRARSGGLRSSELTDPTVTVSSLGERGAESVLGVIYPPQVALIGFGRIAWRPWVVDGRLEARRLLTVTLAGDHRASDGHLGGQLLAAIDRALQRPPRPDEEPPR
ncbi:MAG: 2-oxo acid dehydrogenase subunit E2 [Burkholderiaceae bacterium]|nr:2-oxo acid dehydrogenase subunit E2 [Burkholderiaceae bacterium]